MSSEIEVGTKVGTSDGQRADNDNSTDASLTLAQFRALVGIPQYEPSSLDSTMVGNGLSNQIDDKGSFHFGNATGRNLSTIAPPTIDHSLTTRPRVLILLRFLSRPAWSAGSAKSRADYSSSSSNQTSERSTSIYYSLLVEESDQWRLYHVYNFLTYAALILQLVIASVLIIIGAIPNITPVSGGEDTYTAHRISVAVLGAVTGLLTGILSLLKGQGLPNRFLQYGSRLRQVRHRIEFMERVLRAGAPGTSITYQDVVAIWQEYEDVLRERDINKPDAWATSMPAANVQHDEFLKRRGKPNDVEIGAPKPVVTRLGTQ